MTEAINADDSPRPEENRLDEQPAVQEEEQPVAPVDDVQPEIRQRQEQALMFEKYLDESGLCLSFQIIFTEIIQKQVPEDQVFPYCAMRLRQIGKELESIDNKAEPGAGQ